MTNPLQRVLGRTSPPRSLYSTRPYGTSKAEAAALASAATGTSFTTGGSAAAAAADATTPFTGPGGTRL